MSSDDDFKWDDDNPESDSHRILQEPESNAQGASEPFATGAEVPAFEMPADEVPVEEMPAEEILADEVPVEEVAAEERSADQVPVESRPLEENIIETREEALRETASDAPEPEPAPELSPHRESILVSQTPSAMPLSTPAASPSSSSLDRQTVGQDSRAEFFSAESQALENLIEEDPMGEPFELKGAEKLGIVGGKGVGKSYLFQSMVYRTYASQFSGALNYYLDHIRLFSALKRDGAASALVTAKFIKNYSSWTRLPPTQLDTQKWYRLRLCYRTGFLGRRQSAMDVEFFDGSGEGFFEQARHIHGKAWVEGYLDARVMVFCLPLWVAFPGPNLSTEDWKHRDMVLEGFEQVVENFVSLREEHGRTHPISSILALTMADDKRSALERLRDRWITPYMEEPGFYLERLRKGSGIARYLANARQISEALYREFASAAYDPRVSSIPQRITLGGARPWLIPVSAIDGSFLDYQEQSPALESPRNQPPVPIHVELPLLVALCERHNALM